MPGRCSNASSPARPKISHPLQIKRESSFPPPQRIESKTSALPKSTSAMHFGRYFQNNQSTAQSIDQVDRILLAPNCSGDQTAAVSDQVSRKTVTSPIKDPKSRTMFRKFKGAIASARGHPFMHHRSHTERIDNQEFRDKLDEPDVDVEREFRRGLAVQMNLRDSPKVQKMFDSSPRILNDPNRTPTNLDTQFALRRTISDTDLRHTLKEAYEFEPEDSFVDRHVNPEYENEFDGFGLGVRLTGLELSGFDFKFADHTNAATTPSTASDESREYISAEREVEYWSEDQEVEEYMQVELEEEDHTIAFEPNLPPFTNQVSGLRQHPYVLQYAISPQKLPGLSNRDSGDNRDDLALAHSLLKQINSREYQSLCNRAKRYSSGQEAIKNIHRTPPQLPAIVAELPAKRTSDASKRSSAQAGFELHNPHGKKSRKLTPSDKALTESLEMSEACGPVDGGTSNSVVASPARPTARFEIESKSPKERHFDYSIGFEDLFNDQTLAKRKKQRRASMPQHRVGGRTPLFGSADRGRSTVKRVAGFLTGHDTAGSSRSSSKVSTRASRKHRVKHARKVSIASELMKLNAATDQDELGLDEWEQMEDDIGLAA